MTFMLFRCFEGRGAGFKTSAADALEADYLCAHFLNAFPITMTHQSTAIRMVGMVYLHICTKISNEQCQQQGVVLIYLLIG